MNELDQILDDPLFDVSPEEQALYTLPTNLQEGLSRRRRRRESALELATRKPCEDFDAFRPLLDQVRAELQRGERQLVRPRKATTPSEGGFYVVGGELFYLAEVKEYKQAQNRMKDGRTRCIFSNGIETNPLLETLRKGLDKDGGYLVTEYQPSDLFAPTTPQEALQGTPTGYLYILRSRSTHPDIAGLEHLYKIGFTTTTVKERIKGAESDPTYLCAPVEPVEDYATFDLNTQRYEAAIHKILEFARLKTRLKNPATGKEYLPKEWFVCPLPMIRTIIAGILQGTMAGKIYNPETGFLEEHRTIDKTPDFTTDLTGLRVLMLIIDQGPFDDIAEGGKTIEHRLLKPTTFKKYTYLDKKTGQSYLRPFDVLKLYVGYHPKRDRMLIQVTDIRMSNQEKDVIDYHLGQIIELHRWRDEEPTP